jgi:hypothetical protein
MEAAVGSGPRYLALVGLWLPLEGEKYTDIAADLDDLKRRHFHYDPDEPPVVLHRKDIVHTIGPFWRLQNDTRRRAFDQDLLEFLARHSYLVIGVVIDKVAHRG